MVLGIPKLIWATKLANHRTLPHRNLKLKFITGPDHKTKYLNTNSVEDDPLSLGYRGYVTVSRIWLWFIAQIADM